VLSAFAESLEQSEGYGVNLMGFLADEGEPANSTIRLKPKYPVYSLERLPELLDQHVIDEILFAVDSTRLSGLEEVVLFCDEKGVRTRVLVHFFPHVNSEVYLDRLGTAPCLHSQPHHTTSCDLLSSVRQTCCWRRQIFCYWRV
jgi:FlaA1/EpsC-like NDP-sugar epimerase